jgi:hypothetical protein
MSLSQNELDKLLVAFHDDGAALLRRVFEAGMRRGIEQEKARVRQLLLDDLIGDDVVEDRSGAQSHAPRHAPSQSAGTYGVVIGFVRTGLRALGRTAPSGVGPAEVEDYCNNQLSAGLDRLQVLTALKQMTKRGEAFRLARGRYLPTPESANGDEPGATAPDPINHLESMAAE